MASGVLADVNRILLTLTNVRLGVWLPLGR